MVFLQSKVGRIKTSWDCSWCWDSWFTW